MNEYKLFVQKIGIIGIANILIGLSSFILLPILTKNLSIDEYGIWVQVMVTFGLIPAITTLGLPYAMVRFLAAEKKIEKIRDTFYTIFFIIIITSIITAFLLLLFTEPFSNLLFNGNVDATLILALLIIVGCPLGVLLNFFRTYQKMKIYSFFTLILTYVNIILVFFFINSGFGIVGALIGFLISQIIVLVLTGIIVFRKIGFSIPKFKNIREYLSFGLPTIPSNLSSWIIDSSDRYIIGILLGTSFVGYYSPGYSLGSIIIMFLTPFSIILPPMLSKHYDEKNINIAKTIMNYSLKYFLLISIPSVFGLSILSKQLLIILTTNDIATNGYLITPFIALSSVLYGVIGIVTNVMVMEKKTKIIGSIYIIAAFINISLNLIFVPIFGIIGAAAITLLAYVAASVLSVYYSSKYFTIELKTNFLIKSLLGSFLISILIYKINPIGLLNMFLTISFSTFVYLVFMFLTKAIEKDEVDFFRNILKI